MFWASFELHVPVAPTQVAALGAAWDGVHPDALEAEVARGVVAGLGVAVGRGARVECFPEHVA
eukprot:9777679-Lingulodinium_polyedra.AAC.1